MILVGAGRPFARQTAPAIAALAAKADDRLGASKAAGTASTSCTRAASRVAALDLGFVPGEGGLSAAAMVKAGALDLLFLLGADEFDVASRRLRRLSWHPRRRRRASRRRDPAGRGLYREGRPLRQHRGPRAARRPRRLPAGRGQGRLGDPARACRRRWARGCRTTRWRIARAAVANPFRTWQKSARSRPRTRARWPICAAGEVSGAAFVSPISDFYLTNPIARASKVMAECSALAKGAASSKRRNEDLTMDILLTLLLIVVKSLAVLVIVPGGGRLFHPGRPQDLGGRAVAQGPERRRPLRPAADLSPTAQIPAQGIDHSRRRQQGALPARAADHRDAGLRRPGR